MQTFSLLYGTIFLAYKQVNVILCVKEFIHLAIKFNASSRTYMAWVICNAVPFYSTMTASTKSKPGGSSYENMKHEVESLSRAIAGTQLTSAEKKRLKDNDSRKAAKSDTDDSSHSDHNSEQNRHIVVIDIEEKVLKCDRRLLAQHSKYFEALFAFQPIPTNRVRLKGIIN